MTHLQTYRYRPGEPSEKDQIVHVAGGHGHAGLRSCSGKKCLRHWKIRKDYGFLSFRNPVREGLPTIRQEVQTLGLGSWPMFRQLSNNASHR